MTNFLITLILGLWLLVVVAFYALIVGTALCRILGSLWQAFAALTSSSSPCLTFSPGRWRLNFPADPLELAAAVAAAGIFVILAAGCVWTASSLIRYCGLILLAFVPSAWILVRYLKE